MQLSSSDTFYLKFIQPWLVGLILLWVFVDSCNSQTVNGLIVASVIAITMGLLALCGRLKKVFINTNGILTVSDFKRECQFDSKNIFDIKIIGAKKQRVVLELIEPCIFGKEIMFFPPWGIRIKGNKYIEDYVRTHLNMGRDETA